MQRYDDNDVKDNTFTRKTDEAKEVSRLSIVFCFNCIMNSWLLIIIILLFINFEGRK